jgi:RNA recognition motif-containing protein
VKGVDFPSDKNFCFVHFETQEGVDNAMATEEELVWDGFSIWYEPKRLPAPRAPRGVAGGAGRGGGTGKNATAAPKETKQDTAGKDNTAKVQQPQKQPQKQQSQKQRTQSQSQGQDTADGQQGAWKVVEHRNNRRKQTAEKKGDKKTEKKNERK